MQTNSLSAVGRVVIRIDGKLYEADALSVDLDVQSKVRARIVGLRRKRRVRKKKP